MLNKLLTMPEHVDKVAFAIELFNGFFKAGNATACNDKYIKNAS
jgi:hypothetical protein